MTDVKHTTGPEQSIRTVDVYGVEVWRDSEGRYHRIDGPAWVCPNGYTAWWVHGEPHREGGPAIVWPNGTMAWYLRGERLDMRLGVPGGRSVFSSVVVKR